MTQAQAVPLESHCNHVADLTARLHVWLLASCLLTSHPSSRCHILFSHLWICQMPSAPLEQAVPGNRLHGKCLYLKNYCVSSIFPKDLGKLLSALTWVSLLLASGHHSGPHLSGPHTLKNHRIMLGLEGTSENHSDIYVDPLVVCLSTDAMGRSI